MPVYHTDNTTQCCYDWWDWSPWLSPFQCGFAQPMDHFQSWTPVEWLCFYLAWCGSREGLGFSDLYMQPDIMHSPNKESFLKLIWLQDQLSWSCRFHVTPL